MLRRSIGKQSGESVESVLKKKRKATVETVLWTQMFRLAGAELWLWRAT